MTNQLSISRRPRKFSEIVGQQRTINEMYKRSNENNFPQAMMFQGSTGTGKTTMGFIVASLINCSNPIEENGNKEPCGECASCKSVATESFSRSIHLYDGAKLNKEGITKLEDVANNSSLYPNEKNIIIIEEAQEIKSEGAKGALLKLLEKPRKNVHFILLTMDEKKFDTSVKDRCQVYIFKKLKDSEVSDYIFSLLEEYDPDEKFPVTFIEEVIPVIIDNASGSLRKAIEDFERCIFSEIYTAKIAIEELGYMDEKTMYETIVLMANKDKKIFKQISEFSDLLSFFNYSWKIINNIQIAQTIGYDVDWKEKRAKLILHTGNFENIVDMYININNNNHGNYFNPNIFYHFLTEYYNDTKFKLKEDTPSKVSRKVSRRVKSAT